jgi:hypothetical protein
MQLTPSNSFHSGTRPGAAFSPVRGSTGPASAGGTAAADHNPLLLAAALEAQARQNAAVETLLHEGLLSRVLV